MNPMELKKLKETELQMLIEFIRICKAHDLRYFLLGGTALGAVRHKGFIPWDDDIDVALPRDDYMQFLNYAEKELPSNLFLQHAGTDPRYAANYAKIRNSDTTFIETPVKDMKIHHGVYIDIFPLDGTSDHLSIRNIQFSLLRWLNILISDVYYLPDQADSWKRKLCHVICRILPMDYKMLRDWREKIMCRYPYAQAETVANFCGAWGKKEIMPKAIFGSGSIGSFEGLEVMLAENWDQYLSKLYGDYMTPPPEEKRVGHHYYTVLDLEKSYTDYFG